jgi:hypothetical protein
LLSYCARHHDTVTTPAGGSGVIEVQEISAIAGGYFDLTVRDQLLDFGWPLHSLSAAAMMCP